MSEKVKININVLRYKHSQVLGELVNVGILIFYISDRKFKFLALNNFDRIHKVYDNFQENILKQQFAFLKDRIQKLDLVDLYTNDNSKLQSFIEKKILPKDASQLQFGEDVVFYYPNDRFDSEIFEAKLISSYLLTTKELVFESEYVARNNDLDMTLSLWIAPDYKNRIKKLKKDFIYLPSKRKL